MSINAVPPSSTNPGTVQDRSSVETKGVDAVRNQPQDMVDISKTLSPDVRAYLAEVRARGVPITPLTEGSARDAAEALRAALGTQSLPIANANPGTLTDLMNESD